MGYYNDLTLSYGADDAHYDRMDYGAVHVPVAPVFTPTLLARHTSAHGGYEAQVRRTIAGNYGVTIFDLDAGATLPYARHFKTFDAANAYAKQCMADEMTHETNNDLPF